MSLIGLRHRIQWEEVNFKVGQFWVPNTFSRPYLNFKPIFLVVRPIVFPWEDATYMVPRPLQKLGSDSHPLCPHTHTHTYLIWFFFFFGNNGWFYLMELVHIENAFMTFPAFLMLRTNCWNGISDLDLHYSSSFFFFFFFLFFLMCLKNVPRI